MQNIGSEPGKKKPTQKRPKTHRPRNTGTSRKRAPAVHNIEEKEASNSGSIAGESERKNEELRGTVDSSQFSATKDKEAALKKLFTWLRKRNWATSYYDTEDGICVHVDGGILKKETAAQEIAKQFPLLKSFWTYKVVETDPGICQTLSKTTGFNGSGDAVGSREQLQ